MTPASESSAAGSGGVAPAQLGSGLGGSHSGNGVTRDQVWQIVQEALRQRDRAEPRDDKLCASCRVSKKRPLFASGQWASGSGVCLECKPVDDRLQKRAKTSKVCALCAQDCPRADFSATQWAAGAAAKCCRCVAKAAQDSMKTVKTCKVCSKLLCTLTISSRSLSFQGFYGLAGASI